MKHLSPAIVLGGLVTGLLGGPTACSDDAPGPISFGAFGPLSARTSTEGGDVRGAIAKARRLTGSQRATYGGTGPMTPEVGFDTTGTLCGKVPAP